MNNKYNQQVSGCVAKFLVLLTSLVIGAVFFIPAPTVKPLPYVQVTQEQLDYDPLPEPRSPDQDQPARTPVEIFKIKPPSITVLTDVSPGIILHISKETISISPRERNCLIRNVFYESGAEPYEGKIAVAQVTWNRVRSGAWGKDFCKVIYAPNQFSWTRDTIKRNRPLTGTQAAAVESAVDDFLAGARVSKLISATHFHATYVRPTWAKPAAKIKQIGGHVFYALK